MRRKAPVTSGALWPVRSALPLNLLALRRHQIPLAAEAVLILAGDGAGGLVLGEVVERHAVVGDMHGAVAPLQRSDHVLLDALAGTRPPCGQEGRPRSGACIVAGAAALGVRREHVERAAMLVGQVLTHRLRLLKRELGGSRWLTGARCLRRREAGSDQERAGSDCKDARDHGDASQT